MKVTARQDREPIVDGILSGWKQGTDHISLLRDLLINGRSLFLSCKLHRGKLFGESALNCFTAIVEEEMGNS